MVWLGFSFYIIILLPQNKKAKPIDIIIKLIFFFLSFNTLDIKITISKEQIFSQTEFLDEKCERCHSYCLLLLLIFMYTRIGQMRTNNLSNMMNLKRVFCLAKKAILIRVGPDTGYPLHYRITGDCGYCHKIFNHITVGLYVCLSVQMSIICLSICKYVWIVTNLLS